MKYSKLTRHNKTIVYIDHGYIPVHIQIILDRKGGEIEPATEDEYWGLGGVVDYGDLPF